MKQETSSQFSAAARLILNNLSATESMNLIKALGNLVQWAGIGRNNLAVSLHDALVEVSKQHQISFVSTGNNWSGLYVGDQLLSQKHEFTFAEICKLIGLRVEFYFADTAWFEEESCLPFDLADVKLCASSYGAEVSVANVRERGGSGMQNFILPDLLETDDPPTNPDGPASLRNHVVVCRDGDWFTLFVGGVKILEGTTDNTAVLDAVGTPYTFYESDKATSGPPFLPNQWYEVDASLFEKVTSKNHKADKEIKPTMPEWLY